MRALAVFDERDEAPGRRNERARKGRAVGPDRWERVRERRQQKERSRTEKGRAARTRQLPGREVQSGKPEGIARRRDDPVRLRDVATELPKKRHERWQERRVEELEREAEIPVRVPGEIREPIRDEARVRDEGRLDAAAELGELAREEWGDRPRLDGEESDGSKGIDGKATRQGARLDAPSMGPRA